GPGRRDVRGRARAGRRRPPRRASLSRGGRVSALLALDAVSAGYGSFRALFDVSLEVGEGQAVGVIGPNGAGKTTLMRVISGLLPLRGGAMTPDGPAAGRPAAPRSVDPRPAH